MEVSVSSQNSGLGRDFAFDGSNLERDLRCRLRQRKRSPNPRTLSLVAAYWNMPDVAGDGELQVEEF
jgi:hypothetical protein